MNKIRTVVMGAIVACAAAVCCAAGEDPIDPSLVTTYTAIEYVEWDGSSANAIDTGIYPDSTTYAQLDFVMAKATGASFFGSNNGGRWVFFALNSTWYLDLSKTASDSTYRITASGYSKTARKRFELGNRYIKDLDTGATLASNTALTFNELTEKMSIFRSSSEAGRIYGCKIFKQGDMVRDLVPAKDKDGAACLLDLVSGDLFYGKNSALTAGPETGTVTYPRVIQRNPAVVASVRSSSQLLTTLSLKESDADSTAFVCWGATYGGTNPNAWAHKKQLGTVAGDATSMEVSLTAAELADAEYVRVAILTGEDAEIPEWANSVHVPDIPLSVAATVTGATGPADGTSYSCALTVTDPASGYTAKWAWTDAEDFTHDAPASYAEEGVYTNIVKVAKAGYEDFIGMGVVTVFEGPSHERPIDPSLVTTYTAIEYIECEAGDSAVSINTGIYPDSTTYAQLDFVMAKATGGDFFGVSGTYWHFFAYQSGWYLDVPDYDGRVNTSSGWSATARKRFELGNRYIKDLDTGTTLASKSAGTFSELSGPLLIFAKNIESGKVYGCKIFKQGEMVRDFVPVKDGDGVACLLDYVSGDLFYGTNREVTAGPETGTVTYPRVVRRNPAVAESVRSSSQLLATLTLEESASDSTAFVCWGATYGGTRPDAWAHKKSLGEVAGSATRLYVTLTADELADAEYVRVAILTGEGAEIHEWANSVHVPDVPLGPGVPVRATVTGFEGGYDGDGHSASVEIEFPAGGEGCTQDWTWSDGTDGHAEPQTCVAAGVYTNIVTVSAPDLDPFVGTGVVEIAAIDLANDAVFAKIPVYAPTGDAIRPTPAVTNAATGLEVSVDDFDFVYPTDCITQGVHTVRIVGKGNASGTAETTFIIFGGIAYVATTGSDETGDGTEDRPFATIAKGVALGGAAAGGGAGSATVRVADGDYASPFATLDRAILVIGNVADPSKVVITDATQGQRAFTLSHPDAKVAGVKITGEGQRDTACTYGGHVNMSAGTVEDCVIENGRGYSAGYAGNVYMTGGRLCRCRVQGGRNGANSGNLGANIYATGGVIENCLVTGGLPAVDTSSDASVDIAGAAKVINCTIVKFSVTGKCGGIHVTNGGAQIVNCVFYGNGGTAAKEWGNANPKKFVNCAFAAGIAPTEGTACIDTVTDAAFKNYANGNYRPAKGGSVLKGAGTKKDEYLGYGATSPTDLIGTLWGKTLDIGCYATKASGLLISVR